MSRQRQIFSNSGAGIRLAEELCGYFQKLSHEHRQADTQAHGWARQNTKIHKK